MFKDYMKEAEKEGRNIELEKHSQQKSPSQVAVDRFVFRMQQYYHANVTSANGWRQACEILACAVHAIAKAPYQLSLLFFFSQEWRVVFAHTSSLCQRSPCAVSLLKAPSRLIFVTPKHCSCMQRTTRTTSCCCTGLCSCRYRTFRRQRRWASLKLSMQRVVCRILFMSW